MTPYQKAIAYLEHDATHYTFLARHDYPALATYLHELWNKPAEEVVAEYVETQKANEDNGIHHSDWINYV